MGAGPLGRRCCCTLDSQVGRGRLDRGSGAQTLTLPLSLSQGTRAGRGTWRAIAIPDLQAGPSLKFLVPLSLQSSESLPRRP